MGCCCSKEEDEGGVPVPVEVRPAHSGTNGGGPRGGGGAGQHAKGPSGFSADGGRGGGGGGGGGGAGFDGTPPDPAKSVLKRWEDIRAHYVFDKVLGRGQFGVTRLVVHRATGERAACKSISKRK